MGIKSAGTRPRDNGDVYNRRMFTKDKLKHNSIIGSLGAVLGVVFSVVLAAGVFDKDVSFSPTGGLTVSSSVSESAPVISHQISFAELEKLVQANAKAIRDNQELVRANAESIKNFKSYEDQRHIYLNNEIALKLQALDQKLALINSKAN